MSQAEAGDDSSSRAGIKPRSEQILAGRRHDGRHTNRQKRRDQIRAGAERPRRRRPQICSTTDIHGRERAGRRPADFVKNKAVIISRTPLRISFAGGGSDLPSYYREFGGAVISTAINQFVYVTVNKKFDNKIRVSYSRTEIGRSVERIKHPLVREAMKLLNIHGGIEITSIADIPAKGTGLGSSSSFTVGLLHVLHAYAERYASAEQLARESCVIEIERCGEPIGKQDQYAAA